jgi:hypothetical protein
MSQVGHKYSWPSISIGFISMDLAHGGLKILKTNPKPLKLHKVPKIKT